eukprot:gene10958-11112_t
MEEPNTADRQQETLVEAEAGPQTGENQDEAYQVLAHYAVSLTQQQQASSQRVAAPAINKVPVSRKEEVHRLLGQRLVIKCDPNSSYSAPVVILASEEANIYNVIERHFKPGYLLGIEKFWKLVRSELGVDTWRPRVQGSQLKALLGARLPEQQQEFTAIQEVVQSLQDCLKQDSSVEQFMADLHTTVAQIQTWWENRNKRPDGYLKRGAAYNLSNAGMKKRLAAQPSGAADGGLAGLPGVLSSFPAGAGAIIGGANGLPGIAGVAADLPGASSFPNAAVGSFAAAAGGTGPEGLLHLLPNGDIFIDRNGSVFGHILEYLRACVNGEVTCNPLPHNASELQALAREAAFYKLHDLLDVIHRSSIQPQPATRTFYDAILLETGFYSLAGPGLEAMEQSKVLLMEQLNHLLAGHAEQGFFVEQAKVNIVHKSLPSDRQHDDLAAGGAGAAGSGAGAGEQVQYNLQYHMLMKKVVPVLPQEMLEEEEGPLDEEEDTQLQHQEQGVEFEGGAG